MKIIVLYDSFFGNTEQVAKMIHANLPEGSAIHSIKEHTDVSDYDLVFLGSPTRGFRPTKDVLDFLNNVEIKKDQWFAFFDTRMDASVVKPFFLPWLMKWFGYATNALEIAAVKRSIGNIIPSGAFYVSDSEGPLYDTTAQAVQEWTTMILHSMEESDEFN